jgi:hypothetical protein
MMSDNFDEIIVLVKAVIESDGIDEDNEHSNWSEFSIIFEIDEDGDLFSTYGYVYAADGNWHAASVTEPAVEAALETYLSSMLKPGDKGPVKMLLQFNRDTARFKTDFEYENAGRWQVTPANIDRIVGELRPDLGN